METVSPDHQFGMGDYRNLRVWKKADQLAREIYQLVTSRPGVADAELADQLKRAAMSIPNNIAEGSGHASRKEFVRFLRYSIASSCELENQVGFARDVKAISYADCEGATERTVEVRKMLRGLIRKLEE